LSAISCSIHNVHFYQNLMREARKAIIEDRYDAFHRDFLTNYRGGDEEASP
jgi:tRNA-guanine family transglycosylase